MKAPLSIHEHIIAMKTQLPCLLLLLFFGSEMRCACEEVVVYNHNSRHSKHVWTLERDRLDSLPSWKAEENSPISLKDVRSKAEKWLKKLNFTKVITISAFKIDKGQNEKNETWLFAVRASDGYLDSMVCVVLPNGEVLEPVGGKSEKEK